MAGVPTALVVEDDPQISLLLREILTSDGYEVAEVADGALAGPAVRALRPDVVLLDIGLPNVHGFGVLDDLKADPHTAGVPVVVVTAWYTPDLESRARGLGAAAVVGKPFDLERISAAVTAARAGDPAPVANG